MDHAFPLPHVRCLSSTPVQRLHSVRLDDLTHIREVPLPLEIPDMLHRLPQSRLVGGNLARQVRAHEPRPLSRPCVREDRQVDAIRWADLAADCGTFNQAHLIKDFRKFAGSTPEAFLRHVSFLS